MINTRWKKLFRDVSLTKGRMLMMVLAIAVGIFGVGTILSAYSILTREIGANYEGTHPASAYLQLNALDDRLLEKVRHHPGIAYAESAAWVESRIEVKPNEWKPLLLFVSNDFEKARMNKFRQESGKWPVSDGAIWLERTALQLVNAEIGDRLHVQTPNGTKSEMSLAGTVHDPSLAPAWQEQTAYGYVTPSTLRLLGEDDSLHILKVVVQDQPLNRNAIERTVTELAEWLKGQGVTTEQIRIPPPGKHPHQSQMTAILVMLLLFSFMALLLSAILSATMIGGLLTGQVRHIGVMKAVGARTRQIAAMYFFLVTFLGVIALLLGFLPGIAAGRGFASAVAALLNLSINSFSIPLWNYAVLILAGILVPLTAALFPILKATRVSVREAIGEFGTSRRSFGSTRLDKWLSVIRGMDRTFILALRNTFRRRGRLILTLGLLAAAGAMFLTSINVKTGWDRIISQASSNRQYDLELHLHHPVQEEEWLSLIRSVQGVRQVETWSMEPAAAVRPDGLDIARTYPDGGHGSFTLRSAPLDTALMRMPMITGHWLRKDDPANAVVLNHNAYALFPEAEIGDTIDLTVLGKPVLLKLAGVARENLSQAAAYVSPAGYALAAGQSDSANAFRISLTEPDKENNVVEQLEKILEQEHISVEAILSKSMLGKAVSGHVYILIFALILMSVLMAVVGALGLMSTMGTNVVERTREFGIMRTIGGRSRIVIRNVIGEGLMIGIMSWAIALVVSLPLSAAVGKLIGQLAFRSPLPLVLSPGAVLTWLAIIVFGAAGASLYPARKASRLTIRETINHI